MLGDARDLADSTVATVELIGFRVDNLMHLWRCDYLSCRGLEKSYLWFALNPARLGQCPPPDPS